MRSRALRLSVFSTTLVVFVVLSVVIAAKPWAAHADTTPALNGLAIRERHLRHEARVVQDTVRRRWAEYRRRLRAREAQIHALEQRHAAELAAAHASASLTSSYSGSTSRVVTLPPQVRVVRLPSAGPSTTSGSSQP